MKTATTLLFLAATLLAHTLLYGQAAESQSPRPSTPLDTLIAVSGVPEEAPEAADIECPEVTVEPGTWTLHDALATARRLREEKNVEGPIRIHLKAGVFRLQAPVTLRPDDSHLVIGGEPETVVSGGVLLGPWKRGKKSLAYEADLPYIDGRPLTITQLWVNGRATHECTMRRSDKPLPKVRSLDAQNMLVWVDAAHLPRLAHPECATLVLHGPEGDDRLPMVSYTVKGDSVGIAVGPGYARQLFMRQGGKPTSYEIVGAPELLDEGGEWLSDATAGKVYYVARSGEDFATAQVEVPTVWPLLRISGSADLPVEGVVISDLGFACGGSSAKAGFVGCSAGVGLEESRAEGGWTNEVGGAIEISGARNIKVTDCSVERCSGNGVRAGRFVQGLTVAHTTFVGMGGSGVVCGTFGTAGEPAQAPWQPADRSEICSYLNIEYNEVTNYGLRQAAAPGILCGFCRYAKVTNNEVVKHQGTGSQEQGTSAGSGIWVGWGATTQSSCMADNVVGGNVVRYQGTGNQDQGTGNRAQETSAGSGIELRGSMPWTVVEANTVSGYTVGVRLGPGASGITVKHGQGTGSKEPGTAVENLSSGKGNEIVPNP